jgi:LexA-binding, inner membrane-associated putative hydrolase
MTARTHDLAAITALGVIFLIEPSRPLRLSTAIICVIANLIGGITPDIDQPTAPLWRNLPVGRFFGRTFDKLLGGHRFLTHSILGLALFGFAAHWLLIFLHPIMGQINIGLVWILSRKRVCRGSYRFLSNLVCHRLKLSALRPAKRLRRSSFFQAYLSLMLYGTQRTINNYWLYCGKFLTPAKR